MKVSQYPDVNALLDRLLAGIKSVLGDKLVGLYLYGSLVWGDFDHDISDIDLLAATTDDITEAEGDDLRRMHAEIAAQYPQWDDRIEVQYFSLEGLRTFRTHASKMGVISPGEPFHIIEAGADWLMNWYFVLEYGVTLYGPPPATILGPISTDEFIRSVLRHAHNWQQWVGQTRQSRPYQGYAILTMCRTLYTYRHGEQVSKKQAAAWAEQELPEWAPLIRNALVWRREASHATDIDHEATFPETVRFVAYVSQLLPAE